MKIAIIGSNSFLGKHLFSRLFKSNRDLSFYLFGSRIESNLIENECISFKEYIFPTTKLNYELLATFDIIYFCSAVGVQSNLIVTEESIYGLNTFEPIRLAIELEKNNFKGQLVTFGSYFEIGSNTTNKYFSENEVVYAHGDVPNHYCNSKRMLSRYIIGNLHKINWFHFILPTIYGPNENPMRLIPYLINSIVNKEPINITSGTQLRQYIQIDDIVDLLVELLENNIKGGIFNIGPNSVISIKELIETIFNVMNYDAMNVSIINKVDENMKYLALDSSKAKEIFNWQPKIDLIQGIKTYL